MQKLKGAIAAVATPFDDKLVVDTARLAERCRHLLTSGCDAINLLGTTGEATSLTVEERTNVMESIASSGLPLEKFMVGTGAAALGDTVALTRTAQELGFCGALLLPPFYYKNIDENALCDYVKRVASLAAGEELRLYLYNFPQLSGIPYSLSVVQRLRDCLGERLAGLKDSSGDLDYSATIAAETGIDVFPSSEVALDLMEQYGFSGCISATANITYGFCGEALRATDAGARSAAIQKAVAIREALASAPTVPAVKWAIAEVTGDSTWIRPALPLSAIDSVTAKQLRKALAQTDFNLVRETFQQLCQPHWTTP